MPLTYGINRNIYFVFLVLIFTLLIVVCKPNNSKKKNGHRMYGSRDAIDGQFPYAVFHILRTSRGVSTCSGSLLTTRWVLLAAHCVNNDAANPRNHLIVAGKANLNHYLSRRFRMNFMVDLNEAQFDVQERRASRVFFHPSYSRYGNNDVALIEVQRPFIPNSKVGLISLSREPMGTQRICTIAGYGVVEANQRKHILQFISEMPAQPAAMCRRQRVRDVICLADITRGICSGDSGGPIICQGTQRGVASHGLTSGGSSCGVGTIEQYYTDTQINMPWIDRVLAGSGQVLPERLKPSGKKPGRMLPEIEETNSIIDDDDEKKVIFSRKRQNTKEMN